MWVQGCREDGVHEAPGLVHQIERYNGAHDAIKCKQMDKALLK